MNVSVINVHTAITAKTVNIVTTVTIIINAALITSVTIVITDPVNNHLVIQYKFQGFCEFQQTVCALCLKEPITNSAVLWEKLDLHACQPNFAPWCVTRSPVSCGLRGKEIAGNAGNVEEEKKFPGVALLTLERLLCKKTEIIEDKKLCFGS